MLFKRFKSPFRPGVLRGNYPQRENKFTGLELTLYRFWQMICGVAFRLFYNRRYVLAQIHRYAASLEQCDDQTLSSGIEELRALLHKEGLKKQLIFRAFATIREASRRSLGKAHFDVQLFGAWIMINGKLAEMQTGEGKTLTTALAACTAGLAGIPVHVITANDYLASRDADVIKPLYRKLGLTVAFVVETMELEERREKYKADIVHTTNKQIAFDYLRDRINLGDDMGPLRLQVRQIRGAMMDDPVGQPLLRGLCFALVDEADSVLVDEAKTPLIITRKLESETDAETYSTALHLASMLLNDYDYKVDYTLRTIEITADGDNSLVELTASLSKFWQNATHCHRLVKQALTAHLFYKKDEQYIVVEDKIQIIDESTGRLMGDRSWEHGLHQMIEMKEGVPISDAREALARISYQRFFSRYLSLGGASGTLSEVATELQRVYGLDVITVPTNRPSQRKVMGERLYPDQRKKRKRLIERVKALHKQGRPVLIGTNSVEQSETVDSWLTEANLPHQVLNAKQDQQEAAIIARAGDHGAITVATNMAGRGTDIELSEEVKALGGLHVIALSRNSSQRVDRQLYGRSARQGDPGSAETILALDDAELVNYWPSSMLKGLSNMASDKGGLPGVITRPIARMPQKDQERKEAKTRAILMQ